MENPAFQVSPFPKRLSYKPMAESEEVKDTSVEENAGESPGQAEEAAASEEKTETQGESNGQEADSQDEPLDASKYEPEVRKTPSDWYKWRHEQKEPQRESAAPSESKNENEFEGELTPAARKYLETLAEQTFGKVAKPVFDTLAEQEAAKELSQFLADPSNGYLKKYTPVVEKYMKHPAYQQVPVKRIFQMLDYENATMRGAEQRKEADMQAKKNRSGGTSPRTEMSDVDYKTLTPKQYEQVRRQIQEGKQITT